MSVEFQKAKKTFIGFLQARSKSENTVRNYGFDLESLGDFCKSHHLDFETLSIPNLESYHKALKSRGLRPNSCRRKMLTAKAFLRYWAKRHDLDNVTQLWVEKLIPPNRVEQPPKLVSMETISQILREQPDSDLGIRNKALLSLMLNTGMLVTEAINLTQDCVKFDDNATKCKVEVLGRRARTLTVDGESAQVLQLLSNRLKGKRYFFYGYNRSGPLEERVTSRGVELLFKSVAKQYEIPGFHPRTTRHLFIMNALHAGQTEADLIQKLGLKAGYSFQMYHEMLGQNKD